MLHLKNESSTYNSQQSTAGRRSRREMNGYSKSKILFRTILVPAVRVVTYLENDNSDYCIISVL